MSDAAARERRHQPQDHAFSNELTPGQTGPDHLTLQDLRRVRLRITADLGHCALLVREVLELKRGSVLPLSKTAGEMCDLLLNGVPMAKGEVVVIGDNIHVRIAEIVGTVNQDGKEVV